MMNTLPGEEHVRRMYKLPGDIVYSVMKMPTNLPAIYFLFLQTSYTLVMHNDLDN